MIQLSDNDIHYMGQALGYAVMYAKTEIETAEFALLKLKIDGEMARREEGERLIARFFKELPPGKRLSIIAGLCGFLEDDGPLNHASERKALKRLIDGGRGGEISNAIETAINKP